MTAPHAETAPNPNTAPSQPISLFVDAYSTNEWADAPAWAHIQLDEAFIERLQRLQSLCQEHKLARLATYDCVQAWDMENELRLGEDTLVVSEQDFWFEVYPKHSDSLIESRALSIADILKAWQVVQDPENTRDTSEMSEKDQVVNVVQLALHTAGLSDRTWAYEHNTLFYCSGGDVQEFVDMIVDDEELDESMDGSTPP
jgi:hypothetical protein